MRFALVLILAAGAFAAPAFAQPAAPQPQAARQAAEAAAAASTPTNNARSETAAPLHNAEADAALAMSIHMRDEAEQRIARIACAAGDAAKCALVQPAKTPTPTGTPAQ